MIDLETRGRVTVLRLRHGKVNALDVELLEEFVDQLDRLAARDTAAVVLTGNGRLFSAGADLARVVDGGAEYATKFIPALHDAFRSLFAFPKPVVAAVEGAAVAGGCILVCACDHRIMASGAGRIGASELSVGVPFPVSALEVLRYACGDATEGHVFAAQLLTPDEAVATGIVHEVVAADELLGRAIAAAEQLADRPAPAFRLAKQQLRRPVLERIDRDAPTLDPEVEHVWGSADTSARLAAQLERLRKR
jgi:enoyl-CoA hydratase/carnithine racemase